MKPSKCPLRILSPIGEGARRGRVCPLTVAERLDLRLGTILLVMGGLVTAELGGGEGMPGWGISATVGYKTSDG